MIIAFDHNTRNVSISQIAASMVMNTFMSAPWMFISAKMIAASNLKPADVTKFLEAYEFDISVLSVVGGVSVMLLSFFKQEWSVEIEAFKGCDACS